MTLSKNLIACIMTLSFNFASIADSHLTCEPLLNKCDQVVEIQKEAINHHLDLIEKKDEIKKELETENERLRKEEDSRTKQLFWSNLAWLLVLLL